MTNIIIYTREILISFQFDSHNNITIYSVMSLFRKILNEFNKLRYNQNSRFSQYEINKAVDQLCSLNANVGEFDRAVAEQLWQHTTKTPEGTVILKDYIQTIIDARSILQQNIDKAAKQLTFEQDYAEKQQLQECLVSYTEDYKFISQPFNLQHAAVGNLSISRSVNQRSPTNSQNISQIFTPNTSTREESTSLKVVLIITIISIGAQIICMFAKHHFFNILCYYSVIAIYSLNYFDRIYIKLVEILFGVSIVLDLIWLIAHAGDYWSPAIQTQFSHIQTGFLKFIVVLTVLLLLCKIMIGIILFRFTNNTETTARYIKFLNKKIQLTGSNPQNPFERLLKKSDKNQSRT